jgi:hypothetical protein
MNVFFQGKPKYSKKICPDATLSTIDPTCQTRPRTRAAAVESQRLLQLWRGLTYTYYTYIYIYVYVFTLPLPTFSSSHCCTYVQPLCTYRNCVTFLCTATQIFPVYFTKCSLNVFKPQRLMLNFTDFLPCQTCTKIQLYRWTQNMYTNFND